MLLLSAVTAGVVRIMLSAGLLFGAAGTLNWPRGWLVLFFLSGLSALGQIMLCHDSPALAAERLQPGCGRPRGDRVLGVLLAALFNLWFVAMGAEMRLGLPPLADWLMVPGLGLALAGQALSYAAQRANAFASSAVRIQRERRHRVVMAGPYGVIRHPMYAANLMLLAGGALLAGAAGGLMALPLFFALFAIRIRLEEQVLRAALPCYFAYAARVRARLIPLLW